MYHGCDVIETLRTIKTARFRVDILAHVEDINPRDSISWPDDPDEENEYIRKIEAGEYPWFCLGVHVLFWPTPLPGFRASKVYVGVSYLGGVDTYDLHAVGLRDVVREAIADARNTIRQFKLRK